MLMRLHWIFHTALPEQTGEFVQLASQLAATFGVELTAAAGPTGVVLRTSFEEEDHARAFWLELHSRCLDQNLALELCDPGPGPVWRPTGRDFVPSPALIERPPTPAPLARERPPIPSETVYDLLRADDGEMDRNLAETIAAIESAGLPVINLLSYLDLPLFQNYAAEHPEERDQNLFLHMLHTWACYRHAGEVHARLEPKLAQVFTDPRYLRLNTTQFRSPAPALCVQLPDWTWTVRPVARADGGAGRLQWAKEIYLTHLEPPTPSDDRELTLMIVTYDERGEFGFIPLEVPLSLPGVGQSIDAFFAPSEGDDELGANTEDLRLLTAISATYCLYATARDRERYLNS